MIYLPDTSCLVALLCSWHEHHSATLKEMNQRKRAGDKLVLAGPALIETYAVLTRLPYPYRLSENDSWRLLHENFSKEQTVTLTPAQYWRIVQACRDNRISGGQIYDGVIAACARKAKAGLLLTWNDSHFVPFQERTLLIRNPAKED